ncbi:FKBP-type peptidyl-prolyl cis-trans isomerase [Parapedobacter luteus]|uniref:FKBP-type peptidyl-prolyl cis-trans isomerase n=1 Tax=Parapedobacter luteus TaxID=623280 RepID=UPI0009A8361E|nr:hypothetical protein [Parapedobacter luteus]
MKKINVLLLGLVTALGFSSCIDDEEPFDWAAQYEIERPIIEAYARENLANPQYHEIQGMRIWYEVIALGDDASYQYKVISNPNAQGGYAIEAPEVHVRYTTRLVQTDAVVRSVDDDEGEELAWNNEPAIWQAALFPREIRYDEDGELLDEPVEFGGITTNGLKRGGRIRVVTPSYFAYRNGSSGNIPANSPLFYDIEIVEIDEPSSNNNP